MISKSIFNVDISVSFMQQICALIRYLQFFLDYFTQNLKNNIIFGNSREYLRKDSEKHSKRLPSSVPPLCVNHKQIMFIPYFTYVRRVITLLSPYCDAGTDSVSPAGTSEHGEQNFVLLFYGTQQLRQQLQCYAQSVEGIYNPLTGLCIKNTNPVSLNSVVNCFTSEQ